MIYTNTFFFFIKWTHTHIILYDSIIPITICATKRRVIWQTVSFFKNKILFRKSIINKNKKVLTEGIYIHNCSFYLWIIIKKKNVLPAFIVRIMMLSIAAGIPIANFYKYLYLSRLLTRGKCFIFILLYFII